jgi:hypothetical protein
MIIRCHDPRKNKDVVAGEYNRDNFTFIKKVKPEHFMLAEHGYGIQEEVIQKLIILECKTIIIKTKNDTYAFNFTDLPKDIQNYGSGRQRFLRISRKDK